MGIPRPTQQLRSLAKVSSILSISSSIKNTYQVRNAKKPLTAIRDSVNILQEDYTMKTVKKKWEPRIVNIMANGSRVDDLTKYVIPSGHAYYDIIIGYHKEKLRKGA